MGHCCDTAWVENALHAWAHETFITCSILSTFASLKLDTFFRFAEYLCGSSVCPVNWDRRTTTTKTAHFSKKKKRGPDLCCQKDFIFLIKFLRQKWNSFKFLLELMTFLGGDFNIPFKKSHPEHISYNSTSWCLIIYSVIHLLASPQWWI